MATPTLNLAYEATKILPRQDATAGAGSARGLQTDTASKVLSTLAPTAIYAALAFIGFLILRRLYPRMYSPRTYISSLPPEERTPATNLSLVSWISQFFKTSDAVVLNTQETLDGYLFLRLLRLSVVTCFVGMVITWPILIPINASGQGGQTQLNLLTWSNVASPTHPNSYNKYYAHVFCAWAFFGYLIYAITRESIFYISLRQAYLVSPLYANRISSRTVLYQAVPKPYLNEDVLRELLGRDQVKHVWIPLDTDDLEDAVSERDDMLAKLEIATVDLIKSANTARNKAMKASGATEMTEREPHEEIDESGSVAGRWIKSKDRPTHRTGFWGLWGPKVDTIDWCKKNLPEKIEAVQKMQDEHRAFKGNTRNSVFVQFNTLQDAQSAFQSLTHHLPLHMSPRYIGMSPDEIVWYNLRTRWWEKIIRYIASIGIVTATIIGWSFPVAFIASISSVDYLVKIPGLSWLDFINHLGVVTGVVTGLLPVVLLSALMALLPTFLRLMARLGGDPTLSAIEYTVQSTYFWFYTIQGFLVTTLSTGAIAAASSIINNPSNIVSILANSLPAASNFYLSFFIVQGLGVVTQILISIITLILYELQSRLMDGTPRKKFMRFISLIQPSLGSLYPIYTTFLVIAISYSCIAPLVLGFGMLGLLLFYLAYRYNFIYVYDIPFDTKGLMYARALQQLFVGIYLAEGCMIGLFAIKLGDSTKLLGPMILMIIFLIFTVLYHISLNAALRPLLLYLPKTLETEERRLLAEEEYEADVEDIGEERNLPPTPPPKLNSFSSGETRDGQYRSSNGDTPLTSPRKSEKVKEAEGVIRNFPPKKGKPSILMKWLRPDKYADYYTLRRMVPRGVFDVYYSEEVERNAYFHPSVTKEPDLLWVPRDDAGVSKQEVRHTNEITPITDEGSSLNQKGQVVWDSTKASLAPVYERRIYW